MIVYCGGYVCSIAKKPSTYYHYRMDLQKTYSFKDIELVYFKW